jgi:large repetitive protein
VEATPESGRTVAGILWDMCDNAQYTEAQIEHAYAAPGFYDVTVVVTDSAGIAGGISRQVRVDDVVETPDPTRGPLIALAAPSVVEAGVPFMLDAGESLGVNPIVFYEWEFGDGARSRAAWVAKVFETPGLYNVRLRVVDDAGLGASRSQLILVLPAQVEPAPETQPLRVPMPDLDFDLPDGPIQVVPPQAGAPEAVVLGTIGEQAVLFDVTEEGALTVSVPVNQSIVLDARSSTAQEETPIVEYLWDIADGFTTATDSVIEVAFAAPAQYRVQLTVIDAAGLSDTQMIVVNVVE